jgi:hypothetical protein
MRTWGSINIGHGIPIISTNLKRRQLTKSQCAAIAAEAANMKLGVNQFTKKGPPNGGSSELQPLVSKKDAADKLGVSTRSVTIASIMGTGAITARAGLTNAFLCRTCLPVLQSTRAIRRHGLRDANMKSGTRTDLAQNCARLDTQPLGHADRPVRRARRSIRISLRALQLFG